MAELTSRFGRQAFDPGEDPDDIAVFAAAHPAVGPVIVRDDGDEITVTIGSITHGPFNDLDQPVEEAAVGIASTVVDFLEDLFAGRVLF